MSIIQEALKKVQKDVEKRSVASPEPPAAKAQILTSSDRSPEAVQAPAAAHKTGHQTYAAYVLLAVVALTALAIYVLVNGNITARPAKTDHTKKPAESPEALPLQQVQGTEVTNQATKDQNGKIEFGPIELIKDVTSMSFAPRPEKYRGLELNGVMYLDEGPRAIINNAIVGEGDRVEGALVKKINRKNVVLSSGGSEFTLELK